MLLFNGCAIEIEGYDELLVNSDSTIIDSEKENINGYYILEINNNENQNKPAINEYLNIHDITDYRYANKLTTDEALFHLSFESLFFLLLPSLLLVMFGSKKPSLCLWLCLIFVVINIVFITPIAYVLGLRIMYSYPTYHLIIILTFLFPIILSIVSVVSNRKSFKKADSPIAAPKSVSTIKSTFIQNRVVENRCKYCDSQLEDGATFCGVCGNEVR